MDRLVASRVRLCELTLVSLKWILLVLVFCLFVLSFCLVVIRMKASGLVSLILHGSNLGYPPANQVL